MGATTAVNRHDTRGGDTLNPSRFSAATAHPSQAPLDITTPDPVMAEKLEYANSALDEYGDLSIADRSGARPGGFPVHLNELGDPRLAQGNCWSITNEIIESVDAYDLDASNLDMIAISDRIDHVAVLCNDTDRYWVVDYTIRQFNPDLPFPYVGTTDDWKATVEQVTGRTWEWFVEDDLCYDCGGSPSAETCNCDDEG